MKSTRLYLETALREINFIIDHVYPLSKSEFQNDQILQRAAVLSIIVIGEETKKVDLTIKQKNTAIPWTLMAGMRNKMVHHYDGIDTAIVWNTVKHDIPSLQSAIETILSDPELE